MIRVASMGDVPAIVSLCEAVSKVSPWERRGLKWDTDSAIQTVLEVGMSPRAGLWVVELDGRVVGACAVILDGILWNRKTVVANELIWHMHPGFPAGIVKNRWLLRMLDRMRAWASVRGADVFKVNSLDGDSAMRRSLGRRGLVPVETMHMGGATWV